MEYVTDYFWVVVCKNHRVHHKGNTGYEHKILLGKPTFFLHFQCCRTRLMCIATVAAKKIRTNGRKSCEMRFRFQKCLFRTRCSKRSSDSMTVKPTRRTVLAVVTVLLAFVPTSCFLLKTDERVDIVVAATDLAAGRQITDRDITITSIPVSAMTRDMPRKRSEVIGHTTRVPISKGEQILLSKVN